MEKQDYEIRGEKMLTHSEDMLSASRSQAYERLAELGISKETIATATVEQFGRAHLLEWFPARYKEFGKNYPNYLMQGTAYEGTVNGHTVRAGDIAFFRSDMPGEEAEAFFELASIDGAFVEDDVTAKKLNELLRNLYGARARMPEIEAKLEDERAIEMPIADFDLIADVLR